MSSEMDMIHAALKAALALPPHKEGEEYFTTSFLRQYGYSYCAKRNSEEENSIFKKVVELGITDAQPELGRHHYVTITDWYTPEKEYQGRTHEKWSLYRATPGHKGDICPYCGYDNGPNSEFRNGYDCGMCHSN